MNIHSAQWTRVLGALITLCLVAFTPAGPAQNGSPGGNGVVLTIDGPIGPATSNYVSQGIAQATTDNAALVLLRIDTPGGLDQSMREIIKAILASPVPVVSYVSPGGARAASAGTYILYASHIAAMAPATNLGAATPVSIGGGLPALPDEPDAQENKKPDRAENNDTAKRRKVVNDAVAYIRGLAQQRGRNADWAESAVRDGSSLNATQAEEMQVIDLVAANRQALLRAIDGRRVQTSAGEVVLQTTSIQMQVREPDWRQRLLAIVTNPTVAYMLMMIGIYGLILEGYSPGAMVPGIIGGISLLIALFAFQIIPVNYAGMGLLLLGAALMAAEAFAPSFGVLGLGGIAAFVFGSIMLMDTGVPGYETPLAVIAAVSTASALLMFLIIGLFFRSHSQRVTTGREGMLNSSAQVLEDFDGEGWVQAHGERWQATSTVPLRAGQNVVVTEVNGLKLAVKPAPSHGDSHA